MSMEVSLAAQGREARIEELLTLAEPWKSELRAILSQWIDGEFSRRESHSLLSDLGKRIGAYGLEQNKPWDAETKRLIDLATGDLSTAAYALGQDPDLLKGPHQRMEILQQAFSEEREGPGLSGGRGRP